MTNPTDPEHYIAIEVGKLYLEADKNRQLAIDQGLDELRMKSEEYEKDMRELAKLETIAKQATQAANKVNEQAAKLNQAAESAAKQAEDETLRLKRKYFSS